MNTQPQEKALVALQETIALVTNRSGQLRALVLFPEPCYNTQAVNGIDTSTLEGLVSKAIVDLEVARDNLERVIGFLSR